MIPPAAGRPGEGIAPIDVYVQEGRTCRILLGGTVNSDLGLAGQFIAEDRNFDLFRIFHRGYGTGRRFGAGQHFRLELMPGNEVHRYTVSWAQPNLFGYSPWSLSLGGFFYRRQLDDWDEQRLGGRVALGRELTSELSFSAEFRGESVEVLNPRQLGVPELDQALGANSVYRGRVKLVHDTRDSPFLSTRGGLLELAYDYVFGDFSYSRGNIGYSRYFLIKERPGGEGQHTLASSIDLGITGSATPIYDNFYAGGFTTLRGFRFRGASSESHGHRGGWRAESVGHRRIHIAHHRRRSVARGGLCGLWDGGA